MIPFASCLKFNQKRQHKWHIVQTQYGTDVQIENTADESTNIRFKDGVTEESSSVSLPSLETTDLSSSDIALIQESSKIGNEKQRLGQKFLTLQRTPKLTRAHSQSLCLPAHITLLLDTVANKQTQSLLEKIGCWHFSAFSLDITTGGRPLPVLLLHLMDVYGLIDHFNLEPVKVWKCFSMIESGYHTNNPYHNAIHATDVTQAMHCFLQEPKILKHLTPLEKMSALIAAVTHDLDHPGVNQPFLVATSNHLAALYKNASILENHHWRSAVSCMLNSEVFSHLDPNNWESLVSQIQSLILCTDITRHEEFLTLFKKYIDEDNMDLENYECRHFLLQIAMKCADICNPCRPWEISKKWSDKVCEEFFRQGDYERDLKLPVTSMCDRTKTPASKIQTGFIKYVVSMLFELWDKYHRTELSGQLVKNLHENLENWETIFKQEDEVLYSDDSQNAETLKDLDSSVSSNSDSDVISATMSKGRRYTIPLILPQYLPITTMRRESLPGEENSVPQFYSDRVIHYAPMPESPEKQLLQHQPASFPPYQRFSRQVAIPSTNVTCRAEAEINVRNESESSDSSSGYPAGNFSFQAPSSATQFAENQPDSGNKNGKGEEENEMQKSGQHHKSADLGGFVCKCSQKSTENSDCFSQNILSSNNMHNQTATSCLVSFSSQGHVYHRRGSEPVDLRKFIFEIPLPDLYADLKGTNGAHPTGIQGRCCSLVKPSLGSYRPSNELFSTNASIPLKNVLPRRSSFPRDYKLLSDQLVDHLAHISSSESENEASNSSQHTSTTASDTAKKPSATTAELSEKVNACPNRRRSAPIIGTIHCHDRLYALYTAAVTADTLSEKSTDSLAPASLFGTESLWKVEPKKYSASLEYLHKRPSCQNVLTTEYSSFSGLELLSNICRSQAYIEQRTKSAYHSESSFQQHSCLYEQNNSGIDVCSSQYLLSRGRRASAPVTCNSSFVA